MKETPLSLTGGGVTLEGQILNLNVARPPAVGFFAGVPQAATTPWVGLNDLAVGEGTMVYARCTDEDGNFSIAGVPDGSYQLVVWDDYLDIILAFHGVNIVGGACVTGVGANQTTISCNFGDVPVFRWFNRIENTTFYDTNENGFWDPGEMTMTGLDDLNDVLFEQGTGIRFRDGSVYQAFPTDVFGGIPYDEVFPFFNWMVMEVGYDRYKATGATGRRGCRRRPLLHCQPMVLWRPPQPAAAAGQRGPPVPGRGQRRRGHGAPPGFPGIHRPHQCDPLGKDRLAR